MEVSSSLSDRDEPFDAAEAEAPGEPLRLRVPMLIGRKISGTKRLHYEYLKGIHWMLKPATAAEGKAVRDLMQLFFTRVASDGIEQTAERLNAHAPWPHRDT